MFNRRAYTNFILRLLKYSNILAVIMMVVAIYVCFSPNQWLYVLILAGSAIYLGWLTAQYVISESENCIDECNLQYSCQIASFSSRLSIISNLAIILFSLAFSYLLVKYNVFSQDSENEHIIFINTHYIVGFFKLMLIYALSDKIHTSQLLLSILYRYSQTVRYLNINIDPDQPEKRYPEIYLDGQRIADTRYRVTGYADMVTVVFNPTLSLGDTSIIEYLMVEEDDNHIVYKESPYDKYDKPTCFFRCHVVVKNAAKDIPD